MIASMKKIAFLLLFFCCVSQHVIAQNKIVSNSWVVGTQFNDIASYQKDYWQTSLHMGYAKSWQYDSELLSVQNVKSLKYNLLFSLQIDRFAERDFYKVVKNDDIIEYTKISFNTDLEWSILEMHWPKYTNLFINIGLSISPLLNSKATINGTKLQDNSSPQWLNGRYGIGLQTQLTKNSYLSVQSITTMFSDFFDDEIESFSDFHNQVFDERLPKLKLFLISYRIILKKK